MDLYQQLLDLASQIVTPDWGALIKLIPFALAAIVIVYFALTIRRFATAGPTRRAPARVTPVTPPDVHMPGGSSAPIIVAFGAAVVFLGVVIGGAALAAAGVILALTLLVWGREALRDYDRIEPASRLPVVVNEPPPGVHMPGPSIRPFLGALGSAALFAGLVIGGFVLVLAVIFLVWTLIGWLVDFTAEYRKVEEADVTGHLENIPPRRLPTRSLQVFGILFVLIGAAQFGLLPTGSNASAGGPGASPGASGAPAGPSLPPGTQVIVAKNVAYDKNAIEVTAGQPFAIDFKNEDDPATDHNVDIRTKDGKTLQDTPVIKGGTEQVYQYTPLQPGEYVFICKVHPIPQMTGTLTVK